MVALALQEEAHQANEWNKLLEFLSTCVTSLKEKDFKDSLKSVMIDLINQC